MAAYADTSGRRLDEYMAQARANEKKLRQFLDMELRLITSSHLGELCRVLVVDHREAFNLDAVRLLLVDGADAGGRVVRAAVEELAADERWAPVMAQVEVVDDYEDLISLEQALPRAVLACYDPRVHDRYFPADEYTGLGSIALLPMRRKTQLVGVLCLGDADPARYSPPIGTDFLERLALIAAASVENVCNLERLRQLSLRDVLTGVANRRYFQQRLETELARAQRQAHAVGCLYLDLDHFKRINDRYGHAAGDQALIHVTRIVQRAVRSSDVLARLGGEEFAVLLPDISRFRMGEIAERIRASVETNPCALTTTTQVPLSVSVGSAFLDLGEMVGEPAELGAALLEQADRALLWAKEHGRNRVCAYEDIAHRFEDGRE